MKTKSIIALGAVTLISLGSLHAEDTGEDKKAAKKAAAAAKKAEMIAKYDTDKDGMLCNLFAIY